MTMKMHKNIFYGSLLLCSLWSMTSCIDEDLSDCPPPAKEVDITYRLELSQDVSLGYSNEMNSLHLGFWNTPVSLFRERMMKKEELPANLLFRVTLPIDNYSHVAVVNTAQDDGTLLPFAEKLTDVAVAMPLIKPDTVSAGRLPVYTGTLRMKMEENHKSENYEVLLKPMSGKFVLHIEHPETLKDMKCLIRGTQQKFSCWEQFWAYDSKLVTDATEFRLQKTPEKTDFTFYAMPTLPASGGTRVGAAPEAGEWKLYLYSTLGEKIIRHVFTIHEAVQPGRVFEATFLVTEEGGEAVDVEAGMEIDTDWKPGNDFEEDI